MGHGRFAPTAAGHRNLAQGQLCCRFARCRSVGDIPKRIVARGECPEGLPAVAAYDRTGKPRRETGLKPTITVDASGFNTVLREVVRNSSRDAVDVINGRLFAVVIKAIRYTEKANKEEIARELGRLGTIDRVTKSGRRKSGGTILAADSFAARIVNARRRDYAGADYMLFGTALEEAAKKLIAARMRSAAFIKSGWVWAVKQLLPLVKFGAKSNPDREAKPIGRPKGSALPAKPNLRGIFEASAENSALIAGGGRFQSPGAHNPLPIAEAGLRKAMADEKWEMERHLKRKFMEASRRAGATAR